jgi:negative regulator of sigma E activity
MSVRQHPGELGASFDPSTLEKLMAYADGELEGDERSQIEALVQSNPEAARVLEELSVLGECIRIVAETHPVALPEGIADAVIARIHADAAPAAGASGRVIELAARRRRTYALVAGLVAAAAAVVFVARVSNDEPVAQSPHAVPTAAAPAAPLPIRPAPSAALALAPSASAESETPGAPSVSVILVPREGETASSIVIWLGEESPSGGPVK